MKKLNERQKFAKLGGDKLKEMKPKEYWAEIGAKGRESIMKRDPEFYQRLAKAGLHAREVKKQEWIRTQIKDEAVNKLTNLLRGNNGRV